MVEEAKEQNTSNKAALAATVSDLPKSLKVHAKWFDKLTYT